MTVFTATIDRREEHEGNDSLGVFASRESAVQAVRDYVTRHYRPESIVRCNASYGGDLIEGTFYSEDETIEVNETTLQS